MLSVLMVVGGLQIKIVSVLFPELSPPPPLSHPASQSHFCVCYLFGLIYPDMFSLLEGRSSAVIVKFVKFDWVQPGAG